MRIVTVDSGVFVTSFQLAGMQETIVESEMDYGILKRILGV
ncbi:MAG: hypothetical protein ACT4N1_06725 [Nitrososphaerota archaeon]